MYTVSAFPGHCPCAEARGRTAGVAPGPQRRGTKDCGPSLPGVSWRGGPALPHASAESRRQGRPCLVPHDFLRILGTHEGTAVPFDDLDRPSSLHPSEHQRLCAATQPIRPRRPRREASSSSAHPFPRSAGGQGTRPCDLRRGVQAAMFMATMALSGLVSPAQAVSGLCLSGCLFTFQVAFGHWISSCMPWRLPMSGLVGRNQTRPPAMWIVVAWSAVALGVQIFGGETTWRPHGCPHGRRGGSWPHCSHSRSFFTAG